MLPQRHTERDRKPYLKVRKHKREWVLEEGLWVVVRVSAAYFRQQSLT